MICFVEYLIFRELHHQLKISYKVRGESVQSDQKIYTSEALKLCFNLDSTILEVYDRNNTQLCSLDCKWNSCDAEQHRKNKQFYKLYNYAIQREREPYNVVSVSQSDSKNSLIKMARLQELFIVLHSIKRAYYQAWRDNKARVY